MGVREPTEEETKRFPLPERKDMLQEAREYDAKSESALLKLEDFDTSAIILKLSVLECVRELVKLSPHRWRGGTATVSINHDEAFQHLFWKSLENPLKQVQNHLFAAVCSEVEDLWRLHGGRWLYDLSWSTNVGQHLFMIQTDATVFPKPFWTQFGETRALAALRTLVSFYRATNQSESAL